MSPHPFLTAGRPDLMAHRGASSDRPPGNHMGAFRSALEAGCDHLETDVQLSRDGEVVIFHDERLDELTDGRGRIADHDWADLRRLRYDAAEPGVGLDLLRDVLLEFPTAFFNIDVKTDDAVEPTVALLRAHDARDRVCVAAFGWRRLRRLRRALGPGWCTACSQPEIVALRLLAGLRLPLPRIGDAVQVPERQSKLRIVDDNFVDRCHRAGMHVHVWTVNDPDRAAHLAELGVDAIITDRPADLLRWRATAEP